LFRNCLDIRIVEEYKSFHILFAAQVESSQTFTKTGSASFGRLFLTLKDRGAECDLFSILDDALEFISDSFSRQKSVLVLTKNDNALAGAIVCAHLIKARGVSVSAASQTIRLKRAISIPSPCLVKQLQWFAKHRGNCASASVCFQRELRSRLDILEARLQHLISSASQRAKNSETKQLERLKNKHQYSGDEAADFDVRQAIDADGHVSSLEV
jgi:hypothetical protein